MTHTNQLIEETKIESSGEEQSDSFESRLLHLLWNFGNYYKKIPENGVFSIPKEITELIYSKLSQTEQETAKAFGGCKSCYGKGYSTNIDFATGRGTHFQTDYYLPCGECERGKQIEEMISKTEQECDKKWRERVKSKMKEIGSASFEGKYVQEVLDDLLTNK